MLIDAGAAPNVLTLGSKMSPATMAAIQPGLGQFKVLKILKDAGGLALKSLMARDGAQREPKPWAPLLYAVHNEFVEAVRFLIFEVGLDTISWSEILGLADTRFKEGKTKEEYVKWLTKLRDNEDGFFEEQKKKHLKLMAEKDEL